MAKAKIWRLRQSLGDWLSCFVSGCVQKFLRAVCAFFSQCLFRIVWMRCENRKGLLGPLWKKELAMSPGMKIWLTVNYYASMRRLFIVTCELSATCAVVWGRQACAHNTHLEIKQGDGTPLEDIGSVCPTKRLPIGADAAGNPSLCICAFLPTVHRIVE